MVILFNVVPDEDDPYEGRDTLFLKCNPPTLKNVVGTFLVDYWNHSIAFVLVGVILVMAICMYK